MGCHVYSYYDALSGRKNDNSHIELSSDLNSIDLKVSMSKY